LCRYTTAFEKHCGMAGSKNWRNSVSVLCSGEPRPVKIGIWLGEVGIDVSRGSGGGGSHKKPEVDGRGLPSSSFRLNLSHFYP
jgi:hypothetical protein